jgi:hypothetical protein
MYYRSAIVIAAMLTLGCSNAAVAADLSVPRVQRFVDQPRAAQRDDCAYVEVAMHNWDGPAVFRVTAKGGGIPNGLLQTPVTLPAGGDRLCIPRAFFEADQISICIGDTSRDNTNALLIQNKWMAEARANLQRGLAANAGHPRNFTYNGPSGGAAVAQSDGQQYRSQPRALFRPYRPLAPFFRHGPRPYPRYYSQVRRPQQSPIVPLVAAIASRMIQTTR